MLTVRIEGAITVTPANVAEHAIVGFLDTIQMHFLDSLFTNTKIQKI